MLPPTVIAFGQTWCWICKLKNSRKTRYLPKLQMALISKHFFDDFLLLFISYFSPVISRILSHIVSDVSMLHCTYWYVTNTYVIDVLWCQPIKLIQVVSTSEFHEYWLNDLNFNHWIPQVSEGPQKQEHKVGHNYFTV